MNEYELENVQTASRGRKEKMKINIKKKQKICKKDVRKNADVEQMWKRKERKGLKRCEDV